MGVCSFPGAALAVLRGVELLLRSRQPQVAADVGVEPATELRNPDRRTAALVGGVGDRRDACGVQGVDDLVFAGSAHVVADARKGWCGQDQPACVAGEDLRVQAVALCPPG